MVSMVRYRRREVHLGAHPADLAAAAGVQRLAALLRHQLGHDLLDRASDHLLARLAGALAPGVVDEAVAAVAGR